MFLGAQSRAFHAMKSFTAGILACAIACVLMACEGPPPQGIHEPTAPASAGERTLLVVAGMNYESLGMFPFFIDPVLRRHLESKGWEVAECRWSELTPEKAARFQVVAFLQTPNLPSGELGKDPLFQKMELILKERLDSGGGALVFADQFRGRIQPVLDAWLKPWDIRVAPLELDAVGRRHSSPTPLSLGWTGRLFHLAHRSARGSKVPFQWVPN